MSRPAKLFIPQSRIELLDLLASMNLTAPSFLDATGYFWYWNLDYRFRQLHAGLDFNRAALGEARYLELKRMADEMRALFEGDQDDTNGQTLQGCKIIHAMMDLLRQKQPAR